MTQPLPSEHAVNDHAGCSNGSARKEGAPEGQQGQEDESLLIQICRRAGGFFQAALCAALLLNSSQGCEACVFAT